MLKTNFVKLVLCILAATVVSAQVNQTVLSDGTDLSKSYYIPPEIKEIEEQVINFKDPEISALILARIADSIWKFDEDRGRGLFMISLSKLPISSDNAAKKSSALPTFRKVVSLIARHDKGWANTLLELLNESAEKKSGSNLEIAETLLETDTKLASDFAQQSLQHDVNRGFVSFLNRLRQQDQAEADRLFIQAVRLYSSIPNPDATNFAILGTYLFGPPYGYAGQTVTLTRIGNVFVPNVTGNHPNISVALVQSYLRGAVLIIGRPTTSVEQRSIRYALGYQLLPKAQEFAPAMIGELSSAMSALISYVPVEITSNEAYRNLNRDAGRSLDEKIRDIEKIADSSVRDRLFLDLTYHLWQKKDLQGANEAAARIENEEVRKLLENLILFGQGTRLLKEAEADLIGAMQIASRLQNSFEKCLLWLGIASVAGKAKHETLFNQALASAEATSRKIDDNTSPFLLLYISGQMKNNGLPQSDVTLAEAIRELNKIDAQQAPTFVREVILDPLKFSFPIRVDGLDVSFRSSLQNNLTENVKDNLSIVNDLRDENLRGEGYLLIIKRILENKIAPPNWKRQDKVIRVGEDGIRKSAAKVVMPLYPKDSEKKRVSGVTVTEVQYNGNGDVTEVTVLTAPDSAIRKSIEDALAKWKFIPSKLDEKPISVRGKITFYFVIDSKGKGKVENPISKYV